MADIFNALGYALRAIWRPRMLLLALWPVVAALALWLTVAWRWWSEWSAWLHGLITGSAISAWLPQWSLEILSQSSVWLLALVVLAPAVFVTAVMLAALFEMPRIVAVVSAELFPALDRKHGITVARTVINTVAAAGWFALLWLISLPLWMTGILAPVVTVLLSAYLNQRMFRMDALAEHASGEEYRGIVSAHRGQLFLMGVLLGVLYLIPLFNLLMPVVSGIAYTHYCLAALARLRAPARS